MWHTIKIGDIGEIITGNTPPKSRTEYYGKEYKFIKPTDMEIGMRYTPTTEEYYSEEAFKKYNRALIPPLSTCVVTIGSIGKKITLTDSFCFTNQAVNAVIPNKEKFDPHFVFYALKNILNKVKLADTGASSGRENVSKSNFASLTLIVPKKLETQQKIASILSAYDDLLENNLKRIKLLEEAAQNIYEEWFVNFRFPGYENVEFVDGFPKEWDKIAFSNCAVYTNGFAFKPEHHSNKGIPIVKIKELKTGVLDDTPRYSGIDVPKKYLFNNGTILFSWSADIDVYWWAGGEALLNQHLFIVQPKDEIEKTHFFYSLKNSINIFRSRANGATMKHIKRSELDNVFYWKPSKEITKSFNLIIEPILWQVLKLTQQNEKLNEARTLLLPQLMRRKIDI